jgi:hypothetical protein
MRFNERFVAGRLRRRRLRKPVLDGWLCDEARTRPPERVHLALTKLDDDGLALPIPGERDHVRLGPEVSRLATERDEIELFLGWPEDIVIAREGGVVLVGHGDVVHFGELALDRGHRMERTGYEYIAEDGPEVRVELSLSDGNETRRVMLEPGGHDRLGPYNVEHERSYDPSDRPSGARHHGYFLRVRRRPDAPAEARDKSSLHPLDVEAPAEVVALARRQGLLGANEALWIESSVFSALLARYEGPRNNLEQAAHELDPAQEHVLRSGEVALVESAHVYRGEHGEARLGRATIVLEPTGQVRVVAGDSQKMPGRLRRLA